MTGAMLSGMLHVGIAGQGLLARQIASEGNWPPWPQLLLRLLQQPTANAGTGEKQPQPPQPDVLFRAQRESSEWVYLEQVSWGVTTAGAHSHGPSAVRNIPARDGSAPVLLKQGEEIEHIKFYVL